METLPARVRTTVVLASVPPPAGAATGDRWLDLRRHAVRGDASGVTADDLYAAAVRMRSEYLAYVSARGMEQPDAAWWRGWVAERNPFVSDAFYFVCLVAAAVDAIDRDPGVWRAVVDTPAVAVALRDTLRERGCDVTVDGTPAENGWRSRAEFLARRVYFVGKWLCRIAIARLHRASRQPALVAAVRSARPLAVAHEWVDQRRFDTRTGEFAPSGLTAPAKRKIEDSGECVVTLAVILRSVPFGRAVRAVLARPEPMLLPEVFIGPMDVLRVFARSFSRRVTRSYPPLAGLRVHALFDRDASRDWKHHRRLDNELLDAMVTRWRRAGLNVARLIHPFEHHTWETVVTAALMREYPQARRIGVLQPALSRFRLNEFVTADEWRVAPMPDRVVSYGPVATGALRDAGAPADRIVTGAAPSLARLLSDVPAGAPERNAVLVAFAIDDRESCELLESVREAFEASADIEVWLKFHPTLPAARVLRGSPPLSRHFLIVEGSLADLVRRAAVMVYGSSGTCLEALSAGTPPIHLRTRTCLDQDPLEAWPDLHEVATDHRSLNRLALRAMARPATDREARRQAGIRVLRDYFGPETTTYYEAFAL